MRSSDAAAGNAHARSALDPAVVWPSLSQLLPEAPGAGGGEDMSDFIAATEWVTVYHLPAYTPDLNPVEGIWWPLTLSQAAVYLVNTHLDAAGCRARSLTAHDNSPSCFPSLGARVEHPDRLFEESLFEDWHANAEDPSANGSETETKSGRRRWRSPAGLSFLPGCTRLSRTGGAASPVRRRSTRSSPPVTTTASSPTWRS